MSTAEEQKRAEKSLLGVSDYNIERGILFLLVYNNNLQEKFPELNLREDMFLSPIGKAVYNILLEANNNNEFIDFKILEDKLAKNYTGEDLNNFFLLDKTWRPQEVLFDEYIQVFKRLYKRKEFLDELSNVEVAIKERDDDRLNGIKDKLQNFEFDTKEDDNEIGTIEASFLVESFNKMLDGDAEAKKRGEPLKTGLKDFDALIGGVERGNMIVLGARPSIGKSMTMLNIMESMHSLGYKVMYFSQEMQTRYVFNRIVARNLKINAKKFKDPSSFTPEERTQIKEYLEEYANDHSRHLYYNPDMSSADILAAAKKVKKKYGLDAIFIDYLGKIKPNSRLYKNRSMNDIVTEISGQIFALGSALNVAVFTASQLSRSGQKNQAEGSLYIPRMEDLRDSGSIEQDADMIFGLSMDRDAQKNWYGWQPPLLYHLFCLKNRNGPMADITLDYYPWYNRLENQKADYNSQAGTGPKKGNTPTPDLLKVDNVTLTENIFNDPDLADALNMFADDKEKQKEEVSHTENNNSEIIEAEIVDEEFLESTEVIQDSEMDIEETEGEIDLMAEFEKTQ